MAQATALNVNNMIGIGPFITVSLLVADMGSPQALLCWMVGAVVALCERPDAAWLAQARQRFAAAGHKLATECGALR